MFALLLWLSFQFTWSIKRSGESTHPCKSPTPPVDDCDLIPPKRTNFWTGIQCIGGQEQAAVNTALPQHSALPKAFLEGPDRMVSWDRKNKRSYLWPTLRISQQFSLFLPQMYLLGVRWCEGDWAQKICVMPSLSTKDVLLIVKTQF